MFCLLILHSVISCWQHKIIYHGDIYSNHQSLLIRAYLLLCSRENGILQNSGVGSHSLLQGISPTQGSNPSLPHCRWILYQLSHKGSPRILEWVAYPFSRGSSRPRNQTGISCITGRFFTN